MVVISAFIVLVVFYFFSEGSETSLVGAMTAMGLYGGYLILYHLIAPIPDFTSRFIGLLFDCLPLVSFGAILFPHFNSQMPEAATRIMGWLGLVVSIFVLGCFKFFVW